LREERRLRVFEIRELRRIFRPTRDVVTGEWRQLTGEERNDLYLSPNIVRAIKWRRMSWTGHVASEGDRRLVYRVLWGKRRERDSSEDPGIDGRIILRWIFGKRVSNTNKNVNTSITIRKPNIHRKLIPNTCVYRTAPNKLDVCLTVS
jgi:hypothetical protein